MAATKNVIKHQQVLHSERLPCLEVALLTQDRFLFQRVRFRSSQGVNYRRGFDTPQTSVPTVPAVPRGDFLMILSLRSPLKSYLSFR